MKSINIQATSTSPAVTFNLAKNIFEISGCSRPEDVVDFYGPIIDWIIELKQSINDKLKAEHTNNPLVFKINYDYFNSASAKYILDMVMHINSLFKDGLNVKLEWYYKKEDEDMLETGQEFTDIINCPIEFIAI